MSATRPAASASIGVNLREEGGGGGGARVGGGTVQCVSFDMPRLPLTRRRAAPNHQNNVSLVLFLRLIKITTANNHRSYRANYLN